MRRMLNLPVGRGPQAHWQFPAEVCDVASSASAASAASSNVRKYEAAPEPCAKGDVQVGVVCFFDDLRGASFFAFWQRFVAWAPFSCGPFSAVARLQLWPVSAWASSTVQPAVRAARAAVSLLGRILSWKRQPWNIGARRGACSRCSKPSGVRRWGYFGPVKKGHVRMFPGGRPPLCWAK